MAPVTHASIEVMEKKPSAVRRNGNSATITPAKNRSDPKGVSFPVVGIGASAGGLEALEHFLSHIPKESGTAFVIVQHLDPTRKGIMPELLQRATSMKVIQVKDRMKVKVNCVYVIPPNKDMSILHGVLHLLDPVSPRGLRLPIDYFLRSLAQDRQDQSVGVILSGMGSDGTLGLRAIKEKGGVVLVQEPATAKFDGMPRSAIESGLADIVAPVDDLPARIIAFQRRVRTVAPEPPLEDKTQSALEKAVILLRTHTSHDFSHYKKNTFYRRIERRMGIHQIGKIGDYVRYLQANSQELDLLFKELLIGVTSFFRDPSVWEELRTKILPALVASRPDGQLLRVWVAGCSTGEEAYSLAMVFQEVMETIKPRQKSRLQIFATDLDKDAIDKARQGVYPENIAADVTPQRMARFFIRDETGFRVSAEIRGMVTFAVQNVVQDPPFTKLDILSCRNLMIYLTHEVQKKLIPLFHYGLTPGGVLMLGSAESVGTFANLFSPLNPKLRIFRRTESMGTEAVEFPASFASASTDKTESRSAPKLGFQSQAERLILDRYAPPAVFVSEKGDILYVSGHTRKYLEPASGKANWNIFVMAGEGMRFELSKAFHQALEQKEPVVVRGLKTGMAGNPQYVDITIQRLDEPEIVRGLIIILFVDATAPMANSVLRRPGKIGKAPAHRIRMEELERKYLQARLEAQTVREEMQTSHEELRSSNEEHQSNNEELQSSNEELTTSKEEMQSLNEELQTVNNELLAKVDALSRSNNDMKNLLNSTDIATLFLDNSLQVRRFTTQAAKIIKLIPGDIGRPVTDLASELVYPELITDAQEVLQKLGIVEKSLNARDGRWFTLRIMPYRTLDNRIDGIVITFADVTAAKTLEAKLREHQSVLEKHIAEQSRKMEHSKDGTRLQEIDPKTGQDVLQ